MIGPFVRTVGQRIGKAVHITSAQAKCVVKPKFATGGTQEIEFVKCTGDLFTIIGFSLDDKIALWTSFNFEMLTDVVFQ